MSATRDRINTFFKYKDLLRELVVRDVKLKYRRSFLGYVWSILNPLLIMLVMTLVFSQMFQRGIENFPVYLLTGQALFDFMNNATHMSMYSVLDNGALIKKIYVPKYIFTLSKVTSSLIDLIFSMGALILVMLITRAPFSPYLLLFPLVVIPGKCRSVFLYVVWDSSFQRQMYFSEISSTFIMQSLLHGCM